MPAASFAMESHAGLQPRQSRFGRGWRAAAAFFLALGAAACSFLLHFNFSTTGSLQLFLVVVVSLYWGFLQATVASVASVASLNLLFTQPLFRFTVADRQNWIALVTFEAVALVVSRLSSQARLSATQAETQRARAAKLYELSRAILLMDSRRSAGAQLSILIHELMGVDEVGFWIPREAGEASADDQPLLGKESAREAYLAGVDRDDPRGRASRRMLRSGTTAIGAIVMLGWEVDQLLADAVASLAAIAVERARAIDKENRAEVARNAEQLRTAVLDGLAHSFKTPLTAIQTASGGLLAIGQLTEVQGELVSIVDEQTNLLSQLTTKLLQTAALEAKEVRLSRAAHSLEAILSNVLEEQDAPTRSRIVVRNQAGLLPVQVDEELVRLALLQFIDNAAKYSAVGAEIGINISQNELETKVMVQNEGPPIRHEDRERIFERFYRGRNAAYRPTGTGLGLSIVKKAAEAHGGRAWVECEGTRVCFFLTLSALKGSKG